jgi:hypothetical protein
MDVLTGGRKRRRNFSHPLWLVAIGIACAVAAAWLVVRV